MYIIAQGGALIDINSYCKKLALEIGAGFEMGDTFSVEVKVQNIDSHSWHSGINIYVDINNPTFTPYFTIGFIISDYTKVKLVLGVGARIKMQDDSINVDLGYRYFDDISTLDRSDSFFQILMGISDKL